MLLWKYVELVNDLYAEPENEEILSSFMFPCTKLKQLGPIPKNMEQIMQSEISMVTLTLLKKLKIVTQILAWSEHS